MRDQSIIKMIEGHVRVLGIILRSSHISDKRKKRVRNALVKGGTVADKWNDNRVL